MATPRTMAEAAAVETPVPAPAVETPTPTPDVDAPTPTPEVETPAPVRTPAPSDLDTSVSGNLQELLQEGGSYLTQARQQGTQQAASRGLGNSSIAGQAAQGEAIRSSLPIAQQDAATDLSKWTLGATVSSNLQGQYSSSLDDILNQYAISVNQIETAQNISTADKDQMIENSIARRDADLAFLQNMYNAMPGFNTDWGLFPSA